MKFDHILLIGFGGPTRPEEVKPFLEEVTRGLPIPSARLQEVAHHYEQTGGSSAYTAHAFLLLEKLKQSLAAAGVMLPVFIGMRNWHPFLKETMPEIKQRGLKKGIGVILAPHRSPASFEKYVNNVEGAKQEAGAQEIQYEYLKPWHDNPFFIQAQAGQVRAVLNSLSQEESPAMTLLFSAHSIPLEMAGGCRYEQEFKESSALVAQELQHSDWLVAYQSRSGNPRQPWLEPDVLAVLHRLKEEGKSGVVLVPAGWC
jgi:ferrochelatase